MDDVSVSNGVVKFQALWKKYYVQQKLLETRKEFEDIHFDLEGITLNELAWPVEKTSLALPRYDDGTQQLKSRSIPVKLIGEKPDFSKKTLEGVVKIDDFEYKIESNDKCCQAEFSEKHATSSSVSSCGKDSDNLSWIPQLPVSHTDKLKDDDFGLSLDNGSDKCSQRPMQVSGQRMEATPENVGVSTSTPSKTPPSHLFAHSAKFGKGKAQFSDFLTDSWLSGKSFMVIDDVPSHNREDKRSLAKLHEDLSLELLWIRQAIKSRKDYLKLKGSIR